jgi:hypothetical protein
MSHFERLAIGKCEERICCKGKSAGPAWQCQACMMIMCTECTARHGCALLPKPPDVIAQTMLREQSGRSIGMRLVKTSDLQTLLQVYGPLGTQTFLEVAVDEHALRNIGDWFHGVVAELILKARTPRAVRVLALEDKIDVRDEVSAELKPSAGRWKLEGYDTFANEHYPLNKSVGHPVDDYATRAEAEIAAEKQLEELEKTQPTLESGGQTPLGIQDRVLIVAPDGGRYRYFSKKGSQ